ncbi:FadR/GntR family transcriptional regulator [Heyndrickxia acidicola]|uniref:GntR family transcriptional regulator n=1 Tax=Heyndrickxia acidicola TaxID=209389 RepID=A0ABU6MLS8_9BACI|nr:GntR family transcriptional regulator [Heyndrickxia acidicola]MED1205449.1 GntR family transcriptional regulator [Heyndrickxia acidicola]
MNFNEIKKNRVYEQVIEQVKYLLEIGQLRAGDKLPSERELAVLFNVSRSVIREAMTVLKASGVLNIRPGIGVFIAADDESSLVRRMDRALKKDVASLQELLEVRPRVPSGVSSCS